MFTTHKNIKEFYDWWKQQDHKKHTCADMVLFTLCKAYWKNPEMPDYISQLKRAFRKHKHHKYQAVVHSLEWMYKHGGRFADVNTFKGFQSNEIVFKNIASIMANGVDEDALNQEANHATRL